MPACFTNRFVAIAVVTLFSVLATVPRGDSTTLHLATGDHFHLSLGYGERDRHADSGRTTEHTHTCDHDHGPKCDANAGNTHSHECVEIGLPSDDYKPTTASADLSLDQVWSLLLPLPTSVADAAPLHVPSPARSRASCPLGFAAPDLVGSTILLI